jgi:hypothetical protein
VNGYTVHHPIIISLAIRYLHLWNINICSTPISYLRCMEFSNMSSKHRIVSRRLELGTRNTSSSRFSHSLAFTLLVHGLGKSGLYFAMHLNTSAGVHVQGYFGLVVKFVCSGSSASAPARHQRDILSCAYFSLGLSSYSTLLNPYISEAMDSRPRRDEHLTR